VESVFDRKYLENVLIYKPTPFEFEQRRSINPNEEMVRVRDEASSARSKRDLLPLESQ
jgi:hypothetical protein